MKKTISAILILIALSILGIGIKTNADGPLQDLTVNGTPIYHYGTSDRVQTPQTYVEKTSEFRGVWVATVYNLNMPQHSNEAQYKAAYDALLDKVEASHMNAILFQVRPRNDAFYASAYAPFSRYLTGTEGGDPGWDVMEYLVSEAHARGIQFHAWMNPYRVTTNANETLDSLYIDNFARQNPELVIADKEGKLILNPGEPAVVQYIKNVVSEIMDLYDVDGIHFDDYFYPYAGVDTDGVTYNTYKEVNETLADFRRENVNDAIRGVKEVVDAHNLAEGTDVRFGVSPLGLWKVGEPDGANVAPGSSQTYYSQYADTKKWVDEGWVHYMNPQIYWNFNHSLAPYADVVDWWVETVRGTGVDLIIGHGIYKIEYPTTEFYEQMKYNQKYPEIKGSMLYSAAFLQTAHMDYVVNNAWTTTPLNMWATSDVDSPTYDITGTFDDGAYRSDVEVSLSAADDVYYHLGDFNWTPYTTPLEFSEQGNHVIYIKAINASLQESLVSSISIEINKINSDVPTLAIAGDMLGDDYVIGSVVTLSSDTYPIWVAINKGSIGAWELYDGPITLNETGRYFFQIKTINDFGIESALYTQSIDVAQEVFDDPIISLTGVGTDPYYQSVETTLTSDAPSMSYKINDGDWIAYTSPFTIDQEGSYQISVRNEDGLKHVVSREVIIDQTIPNEPVITITGEKEGLYYIEETTVTLSSLDDTDTIYYRLHNGTSWSTWKVYNQSIEFIFEGNFTLEYYAQDQALNTSEVLDERLRLALPPTENNRFVVREGEVVNYFQTDTPIELPTTYTEKTEEIRAVWVATVANIDIGMHVSEASYKTEIITMLNRLEALNFNVMFFQVRPMNDAFYDSDYAPWSRYIMGAEGSDPGWDIFGFIIEEAHKRGIEVHAWLNPYRVSNETGTKASQLNALHDDNFAKQNPDLVIAGADGKLILNPGEARVRAYLTNVVSELMSKYDIDGIHFDDYFYLSNIVASEDQDVYNRTKNVGEELYDWRRRNVDMMIENLSNVISTWNENQNTNIKFGISPSGIWKSKYDYSGNIRPGGELGSHTSSTFESYNYAYADTRKWVMEGWLDYIMPQLYWQFDHSSAPFADLVDWWAELTEASGVDLIIGIGFYRYTDNTWDDPNELTEQLRYISQYDSIIGSSFFSYKTLNNLNANVVSSLERMATTYWTEYPSFPWESDVVKQAEPVDQPISSITGDIVSGSKYEDSVTITLVSDDDIYYKIGNGTWILYSTPITFDQVGVYSLSFKAVDDQGIESTISVLNVEVIDTTCAAGYEYVNGSCALIEEEEVDPPKTGCFSAISTSSAIFITFALVLGTSLVVMVRKKEKVI
ncbi:family 10 glycosylhydrolase [Mariniplasma anaerobium]|uniref:Glycosyl hydrolase-like 10 domain-containing protein n=1 Tax=Mariniplasma anaerobium TaxID=2735436 RepID=A0A7U9XVR1_9MOLU|nr:family 10 glycosylhydrolase [Mariniplasma anaerobium]BCR36832.1 hypothetical protein MPAN_017250 [Mariniplasma anaerobium]